MGDRAELLKALGGEAGCRRLSSEFYSRVQKDEVLRLLFPGKSIRCATEEFSAFLIQFLGGDEAQTQKRWWLSLRESHSRFRIGVSERAAWLKLMTATLEAAPLEARTREALRQFFERGAAYVAGEAAGSVEDGELAWRWDRQRALDDAIHAIVHGYDEEAIAGARQFESRPTVFVGLLARMVQSGRDRLILYVVEAIEIEPALSVQSFSGRALLHFAAGAGSVEVVELLLRKGAGADMMDRGGHTALYCVSNECASASGPELVRLLIRAGADVNACGGVTRATPLHMAARRGFVEISKALIDCGADIEAADRNGDTPLRRAWNCRRWQVARLLVEHGAKGTLSLADLDQRS